MGIGGSAAGGIGGSGGGATGGSNSGSDVSCAKAAMAQSHRQGWPLGQEMWPRWRRVEETEETEETPRMSTRKHFIADQDQADASVVQVLAQKGSGIGPLLIVTSAFMI